MSQPAEKEVARSSRNRASRSNTNHRTSIIMNNKAFDPRKYVAEMHKDTSYNDLVAELERMRTSIDQRAEALKSLVHSNFDRFVNAKNTLDNVHEAMKKKGLRSEEEFATRNASRALEEASVRASQVYGPLLERRAKAEKIRGTLNVLEKYKFFFSLPSTLQGHTKQRKYDAVVRDYKKGKFLYQSSTENDAESEVATAAGAKGNVVFTEQNRKVFEKIWSEVDSIIVDLRATLFRQLSEFWRPMDDQEKTINILVELDSQTDPVWFYLDSQYKWIVGSLNEAYDEEMEKIQALRNSMSSLQDINRYRALALKRAILASNTKNFEASLSKELDVEIWQAMLNLVKTLSDMLLRSLPDFWKLCKSFIEGKFQNKTSATLTSTRRRRQGMDLHKVEQCQQMAREVVDIYASLITKLFAESPENMQNANPTHKANPSDTDQADADSIPPPSFLPPNTASVSTCYFLTRIIVELASCVNDINSINMAGEAFSGLSKLMGETRKRFVDAMCYTWNRDAKTFYMLENWTLDHEYKEITAFTRLFFLFQKNCSRNAFKIASLREVGGGEDDKEQKLQLSPVFVEKIRGAFLDSLYAYLDGLVHLAFSDYVSIEPEDDEIIAKRGKLDVHSMDCRILITISNLTHLKSNIVPKLISMFEAAYQCKLTEETKTIMGVLKQLDNILFEDFVKRKNEVVSEIVRNGILNGGIDWYTISKPTEVHSFVYEALLSLVLVHAQVNDIAPPLVHRSLSAILDTLVQDCLDCFQKVPRFGMGGMLQATLEVEFMHQTLGQYVTPNAANTLQQVYTVIEKAYEPPADNDGSKNRSSAILQTELSSVKKVLTEAKKSTALQYSCFKKRT
ncbi:uncharacterized protein VTP21DRAFT_11672 [Calcarisporiella thermophila]|uniref:uncharacterized protein n=1 Tax=Calcarisporiella thermophila TaxID=911321 RepID=UPI00374461E2